MTRLNFDPLLMTDAERVRRVRELDLVVNEAAAVLAAGKPGADDEALALLRDAGNPDARPDRSALARAVASLPDPATEGPS